MNVYSRMTVMSVTLCTSIPSGDIKVYSFLVALLGEKNHLLYFWVLCVVEDVLTLDMANFSFFFHKIASDEFRTSFIG